MNDDTKNLILQFVGGNCYKTFASLNYHSLDIYNNSGWSKETYTYGYMPLEAIKNKVIEISTTREFFCGMNLAKAILFYNRKDIFDWLLTEDGVNNKRKKKYMLRVACELAAKEGRIDLLQ